MKKSFRKSLVQFFNEDAKKVISVMSGYDNYSDDIKRQIVENKSDVDDIIGSAILDATLDIRVEGIYADLLTEYIIHKLSK